MIPTVQWHAYAGVTHAWMAQCEGYVSLCGREVTGFGGQRSGIRCAQCVTSTGWAEQTGQSSYLTPQQPMETERATHRHIDSHPPRTPPPARRRGVILPGLPRRSSLPPPTIVEPRKEIVDARPIEAETQVKDRQEVAEVTLQVPESIEVYRTLPDAEQRYWAPLMLARAGQEAVWDREHETAQQFQQRCYQQVRSGG